jgi:predicted thioesterase
MPLTISRHARQRMAQRGITQVEIEHALRHVLGTQPGEPGTIVVRGYAPNGDILKVFVRATDQDYIISAMWAGR